MPLARGDDLKVAATPSPDLPHAERVADARAWAIAFMLLVSMALNFIARLVLANVAPVLESELHLTNTQYSCMVFAFMTGMTLGQLPAGMMIDWIGARIGLSAILTGWSVSNMLHSIARGVASFSGLRFVMGLFECGNYSAAVKVIGGLFPARQTALALAVMDSGSLLGSIVAPPLVVLILTRWGWRAAFLLPSLLGFFWLYPWFRIYRVPPAVSQVGTRGTQQGPNTRALLKRRKTWGVVLLRAFSGPITQFYWYWLPLYLVRGRGMSMKTMAVLASVSYLLGGAGNIMGGFASGWLIRRGMSVNAARKIVFTLGASFAAASVMVPLIPDIHVAISLVALAVFGLNVTSCNLIAIISDIFPETTLARVTGLTGMGEGVVNMGLTIATGMVVDHYGFGPVFVGAGVMPLASILALFFIIGRICKINFAEQSLRA